MDANTLSTLPLPTLLTLLSPITLPPHSPRSTFHNWARTFSCTPAHVYAPTSAEECRLVVEYARRHGLKVRAAGVGHSPSDLACTGEVMVRMTGLDAFLGVDDEDAVGQRVVARVQGGITLASLHAHLAAQQPSPLAMSNLGSISEQTLAGVISTATHGSGYDFKVLSDAVDYLVLVSSSPGAPLVRCSSVENSDLFQASLCGLGLTGLIVEVGYRVERAFRLRQVTEAIEIERLLPTTSNDAKGSMTSKDVERQQQQAAVEKTSSAVASSSEQTPLLAAPDASSSSVSRLLTSPTSGLPISGQPAIDILARASQHTRLWWYPQTRGVVVARADRTYEPAPVPKTPTFWQTMLTRVGLGGGNVLSYHVTQFLLFLSRFYLFPTRFVSAWVYALSAPRQVQVDESHKVFAFDCLFPQYTTEWAIPYERTAECLKALSDWYDDEAAKWRGMRPHFPLEIRFVEGDDIWLSPAYGRRTTYLGIVQYRAYTLPAPEHAAIFAAFASIIKRFEGRPHWAKQHDFGERELRAAYERFDAFVDVVKKVDKEGMWRCDYTARHFGKSLEG